jgi:hypothetical protein
LGARAWGQDTAAATACATLADDLHFIHAQLQTNSSPYNHDAAIAERTNKVFEEVLARAPECRTDNDYRTAVLTYTASFHDPHLHATHLPTTDTVSTNVWIRRLNDHYFVWNSTEEAPYGLRRGDEWLGCEGRLAREYVLHDVLALQGYTTLEAALYEHAADAFLRTDKAKGESIDCDFLQDGKALTKTLRWGPVDEASRKRFESDVKGRPAYALKKEPWGYWAGLSAMTAIDEDGRKAMQAFIRDTKELRGAGTIVLDLRGNAGGDSSWGERWISGLIGDKARKGEEAGSSCLIWASPENLRNFKLDPKLNRGQKGFIDCGGRAPLPQRKTGQRVYVLTDAACLSSCEMFVMALRDLPEVVHVGLPTNASTLYGDVRDVAAPSGHAGVMFPQKVFAMASLWKGREPGEPIVPNVLLRYDPALEAQGQDSLRAAVLDLLKRDGRLTNP